MTDSKPISLVEDHPLPTTVEESETLWEDNDHLQRLYDEPPHPDVLRCDHMQVIGESDEWRVFAIGLYGFGSATWAWNYQLGHGIRFDEQEEFKSFAEALDGVAVALGVTA